MGKLTRVRGQFRNVSNARNTSERNKCHGCRAFAATALLQYQRRAKPLVTPSQVHLGPCRRAIKVSAMSRCPVVPHRVPTMAWLGGRGPATRPRRRPPGNLLAGSEPQWGSPGTLPVLFHVALSCAPVEVAVVRSSIVVSSRWDESNDNLWYRHKADLTQQPRRQAGTTSGYSCRTTRSNDHRGPRCRYSSCHAGMGAIRS